MTQTTLTSVPLVLTGRQKNGHGDGEMVYVKMPKGQEFLVGVNSTKPNSESLRVALSGDRGPQGVGSRVVLWRGCHGGELYSCGKDCSRCV